MTAERLVVVGNGMAGIACLEKLLEQAPGRYQITVLGDEPSPNYNRILLSAILNGDVSAEEIVLNPLAWYADHDIALHLGTRGERIDRERKVAIGRGGLEVGYDKLVLATGSRAFMLPIPGRELDGVFVFRTLDDCRRMVDASKRGKRAAVIGGGLLGLEAARGLSSLGLEVTVVHLMDRLMERQLDAPGGAMLARAIRAQGIAVKLNAKTEEILGVTDHESGGEGAGEGAGRVRGLRFADGSELACDLVVMAAGIVPNAELGRDAGLSCKRGVIVDDLLRTSDPDIFAVGECAEHRGICYGLVAPLYDQGRVLAAHLAGAKTAPYEGSVVSTKLKVSGVDVFSAGDFADDESREIVRTEDSRAGVYRKLVLKDGRAIGAVLVGDLAPAAELDRLVRARAEIEAPGAILMGAPAPKTPEAPAVLALADDAIVCACNGVSKGTIVCAIRDRGLVTRKEVAACTNASRSCGGCGPQVDALIQMVHGKKAAPKPEKRALCECTPLSRDEVVLAVRERHLTSVKEVLFSLGWATEGCSTCRPAINYYLTMCWPGENQDDPRSRLVNERVHANIQRDGTYSVVPRMYGGLTTPDELIRIGEVAKKFAVPTVKLTGGQRIDLLGVKKEDLPAVWEALDLPSGFAYAKAVRTVKTCVGQTWCRFGTRDSMALGVRLERTFENLWTPAKVKMAVNACPRNCAESLIKDVGLIAGESVWEIYVGGNGGVKVRQAEKLGTARTDDEAVELIAAFLQLYREQARYGDRTSHFVEEVGIETLRARLVENADERRALAGRMDAALQGRVDPWRERIEKLRAGDEEAQREYAPLKLRLKVVA